MVCLRFFAQIIQWPLILSTSFKLKQSNELKMSNCVAKRLVISRWTSTGSKTNRRLILVKTRAMNRSKTSPITDWRPSLSSIRQIEEIRRFSLASRPMLMATTIATFNWLCKVKTIWALCFLVFCLTWPFASSFRTTRPAARCQNRRVWRSFCQSRLSNALQRKLARFAVFDSLSSHFRYGKTTSGLKNSVFLFLHFYSQTQLQTNGKLVT